MASETSFVGDDGEAILTFHGDGRVVGGKNMKPDAAAVAIIESICKIWPEVLRQTCVTGEQCK